MQAMRLTEEYAFAEIDEAGMCKYCRSFRKRAFKGSSGLIEDLDLKPTERIGVTVSGGKDSIYMWGVLAETLGEDHVELALFKEKLIAACSPSNDIDEGFRNLIKDYFEADYDANLLVMQRDKCLGPAVLGRRGAHGPYVQGCHEVPLLR